MRHVVSCRLIKCESVNIKHIAGDIVTQICSLPLCWMVILNLIILCNFRWCDMQSNFYTIGKRVCRVWQIHLFNSKQRDRILPPTSELVVSYIVCAPWKRIDVLHMTSEIIWSETLTCEIYCVNVNTRKRFDPKTRNFQTLQWLFVTSHEI